MRLDRLIGKHEQIGTKAVRELLASRAVAVNSAAATDGSLRVGQFDRVEIGDAVVQARVPRYFMLHKPAGIVSATVDPEHETVIDLIAESWVRELHLAGRLDRFTTGLVLLTNDSAFSESITEPDRSVPKVYEVETDVPITEEAAAAMRAGLFFPKENITTQPAEIEIRSERACRLTIYEGKHHQVKRMFAQFEIRVVSLHRCAIGRLRLDPDLGVGEYRRLRDCERGYFD